MKAEGLGAKGLPPIKLFADGANLAEMKQTYTEGLVSGFTTNPTLMRKDGVEQYAEFAAEVLKAIPDRPVSFEVFSDRFEEMEAEARTIASWGPNVYVKVPVTNTQGEFSGALIRRLSAAKVKLNVTALLTVDQVERVAEVLSASVPSIVSVFAGRIADTGRDPMPLMRAGAEALRDRPQAELLWASSRELLNIFQAAASGCHIITLTRDILKKVPLIHKDLAELSLDTVKMFYQDAKAAGYSLGRPSSPKAR